MPYSTLLKQLTKDKKLSYQDISNKCHQLGVDITAGYIEDIANNKRKPPSEEKTRAIAKALNYNENNLILEGYIDKSPNEVIDLLNKIRDYTMFFALSTFKNIFSIDDYKNAQDKLHNQSLAEFFTDFLDKDKLTYQNNKNFKLEYDNLIFSVNSDENSFIEVVDNSMAPKIEKGDNIILEITDKYVSGEILAITIKVTNEILYRKAIFSNGTVTLIPDNNKEYKTITYNREDIEIIGKVAKVIKEL